MSQEPVPHGTRDKILIAAAEMLGTDPTARLSVRGVATRAGVSTGSLRHFFPTQRDLIDTVVAGLASIEILDDPIHDTSRTASERLLACLQLMLEHVGKGEQARAYWQKLYEAYVATAPTDDDTLAYLALDQLGRDRIEGWLAALVIEGAIPPGDNGRRARFLGSMLNGLLTERVLPTLADQDNFEEETLRTAVRAITGHHG